MNVVAGPIAGERRISSSCKKSFGAKLRGRSFRNFIAPAVDDAGAGRRGVRGRLARDRVQGVQVRSISIRRHVDTILWPHQGTLISSVVMSTYSGSRLLVARDIDNSNHQTRDLLAKARFRHLVVRELMSSFASI